MGTGAYDLSRWQWIDDNYGPMGWFSDEQKRAREGVASFGEDGWNFTTGHWREIGADERERANRDFTRLYRSQA